MQSKFANTCDTYQLESDEEEEDSSLIKALKATFGKETDSTSAGDSK